MWEERGSRQGFSEHVTPELNREDKELTKLSKEKTACYGVKWEVQRVV